MRILIVEDEPAAAKHLSELIKKVKSDCIIGKTCASVRAAIEYIIEHSLDLIFMDVQLEDGLCFEVFDTVQPKCPVIFCTAYDGYAIDAFKANGIDYILKPVRHTDIESAFDRYDTLKSTFSQVGVPNSNQIQYPAGPKQRFLIRTGNKLKVIEVKDIALFEARDKSVLLMTYDGRDYYIDDTLNDLETKLEKADFFRVNRQQIIAYSAIETIDIDENRYHIRHQGDPSPSLVSRDRMSRFRSWLDR